MWSKLQRLTCLAVLVSAQTVSAEAALAQVVTPPEVILTGNTLREESWFANQYSRNPVTVRLRGISDPVVCQRQEVIFYFLTTSAGGTQIPTASVPAQWVSRDSVGFCEASIRWRLGDAPGLHHLRARLKRDPASPPGPTAASRQTVEFRATAHMPASLIIGLARSSNELDGKHYVPIVGADFPIVHRSLEALYPALNRVRVSVATGFGAEAGDNVYLGLQVFPLFEGPRVLAFPLQLTFGYRAGKGSDAPFAAVHYNASSALGSVLTGLGVK